MIASVLLLNALEAHPTSAQPPVVRDSAGVRIVENGARVKAPVVFRLGPALLDVGGIEGNPDEEFNHNQGYLRGVRLSAGGLAVIDVVRVHYFNAQSKRLKVVGRQGRGPEEFLYLMAICRTRADTLVVGDGQNRRLGVLDASSGIVRTISQGDLGSPPFDFCFDDGTFVLQRSVGEVTSSDRQLQLTRLRLDGSVANVIGEFPGRRFDMVTQAEVSVIAAGQRLYYGNGERSEVRIYSTVGALLSVVRSADPAIRITEADVERRLSGTIPRNVSASERSARMDRMRAMRHADTWPAYGRIHVDPGGTLWVQDYRMSYPAPDGWTAFDASGRLLGRLVFSVPPAGAVPLEIIGFGINEVLVRRRDADGAAHLTVYGVRRVD